MHLSSGRIRAAQRAFDLRAYLRSHDNAPIDHGGEWSIDCPHCHPAGKLKKLWVLVEAKRGAKGMKYPGHWICYYCDSGGKDVLSLIQWLEDCPLVKALESLNAFTTDGKRAINLRQLVQDTLFGVTDYEPWIDEPLGEIALPDGFTEPTVELPRYFHERGITPKRVARYGLGYVPKDYPSKHRNRLVVPVYLHGKRVLYVARYMRAKPPGDTKKTVYPFGGRPNRVLFNYDRAKDCRRIYLVEDVFSAMAIGRGAMATLGTQFSQYQLELLLRTSADEIVIIWDRDTKAKKGQSGYEKALKLAPRLAEFWRVRVVELPDDRDPDELPRRELRQLVEATPVLDAQGVWSTTVRQRLSS